MIPEARVSFEIAKILKAKEFRESSLCWYDSEGNLCFSGGCYKNYNESEDFYSAPTHQVVIDWLIEVYKIFVRVEYEIDRGFQVSYIDLETGIICNKDTTIMYNGYYNRYQITEIGLNYALNNLI